MGEGRVEVASPFLRAYRVPGGAPLRLVPAPASRAWMDRLNRWPYRCLPMVIANQAGWFVLNSHAFFVRWDGSDAPTGIKFVFPKGDPPFPAESHFGYGIVTWTIPFLFRTPPGYNLLVRGPANLPKDGISPLEGIVETDWAVQTFTMNWQLTRPNQVVSFSVGEPLCMIVPQRRGELESFVPRLDDLASDEEILRRHAEFANRRRDALATHPWEDVRLGADISWQKHYFRGQTSDGTAAASDHQTRLRVRPFDDGSAQR